MIEIVKQGPRLRAEAARKTLDVNEAYLMVHNAMAFAMSTIAPAKHVSTPQSISVERDAGLELCAAR